MRYVGFESIDDRYASGEFSLVSLPVIVPVVRHGVCVRYSNHDWMVLSWWLDPLLRDLCNKGIAFGVVADADILEVYQS